MTLRVKPTDTRATEADLRRAEARIADLEATVAALTRRNGQLAADLAARSHDLIVARDRADLAVGILRRQVNAGAHVVDGVLVRSTRGPLALTDAEAALFDTLTHWRKL
jgi:multidrug resistance efflux pump